MDLKKFKDIRKLRKLTLKELSSKTNISRLTLSQLERGIGNIKIKNIEAVAEVLNVRIEIIF